MSRYTQTFQTIRSEGGLLPTDLLLRVLENPNPSTYRLPPGIRINEAITQSYTKLLRYWENFRDGLQELPEGEQGMGLTNTRWSLPLLNELGFGILPSSAGPEINGRSYPISRFFGVVPIHLVGGGQSLDYRTPGQRGAAASSPHGIIQEFLNISEEHLWGITSNGKQIRILRSSMALSRQSFLEFDLEAIFDGEAYSDFRILWLVAHASNFDPVEPTSPDTCQLEKWAQETDQMETRILGELREGVEKALEILGEGLISHPKNESLREALRSETLSPQKVYEQLLRIIFRLIFLFVAEDRTINGQPLIHPIDDHSSASRNARRLYMDHYSTKRLRKLAGNIKGGRHCDLWKQFNLLSRALSDDESSETVRQQLALSTFGSFLWNMEATADLNNTELTNYDFLELLRNLAFTRQGTRLRSVDYKNLGAEELGGIYEVLLALTPQISGDGTSFWFEEFAGNERKTSGSYFTPDSLVQNLLDTALEPVVEAAVSKAKAPQEKIEAILNIKVCDPAVGSGHFLVGAAHRLAKHLALARALAAGESEPSPLLNQQALRDVIGRCLYGVDINPMSAELCRVSLWIEALEPGKPLSFLEHHIQVGNSLLGTNSDLIANGLPNDAFKPLEGDDREIIKSLKKLNREELKGQGSFSSTYSEERQEKYTKLAQLSFDLENISDDNLEGITQKEAKLSQLHSSEEFLHQKKVADAWCAAFVWPKSSSTPNGLTTGVIRNLEENSDSLDDLQEKELNKIIREYQFFHWHLAFPEVFLREDPIQRGFDCIIGNPPWEYIELKLKEWFSKQDHKITSTSNEIKGENLISELQENNPNLHDKFLKAKRFHRGISHFLRHSGRYPLCGRDKINYYTVFAETMRILLNEVGLTGAVLPTGIATGSTTKFFFQELVETKSLISLFDFENRKKIFPDIDSRVKFCLLTVGSGIQPIANTTEAIFFAHELSDLHDPERRLTLTTEDFKLLNPNTLTSPILRSHKDATLTKAIFRRKPVLILEIGGDAHEQNPWQIKFYFNNKCDSNLLRTCIKLEAEEWQLRGNIFNKNGKTYLPLYEPKLYHQFDHRFATFDQVSQENLRKGNANKVNVEAKQNPEFAILPRYWLPENEVQKKLNFEGKILGSQYLLTVRRITSTTNERTGIATFIRKTLVGDNGIVNHIPTARNAALFMVMFNSFAFDFVAHSGLGGNNFSCDILEQLPVALPEEFQQEFCGTTYADFIVPRVVELTYTSWELQSLAEDLGYFCPPFRWDDERRFQIRCELDAVFFLLYFGPDSNGQWLRAEKASGCPHDEAPDQLEELRQFFPTPRDAVDYIMDTFPILRDKDLENYGKYRTKHTILEIYDNMLDAIYSNTSYQTKLDPPPGLPLNTDGNPINITEDSIPPHIHPPMTESSL